MRNKAVRRYSVRILCQEPVFLQGSYFFALRYRVTEESVSDVSQYRQNTNIAFILRLFFFSQYIAICQFRLCITASRTKALGVGLSPYPYQGFIASLFDGKQKKNAADPLHFYVAAVTFHVPPSGIIYYSIH